MKKKTRYVNVVTDADGFVVTPCPFGMTDGQSIPLLVSTEPCRNCRYFICKGLHCVYCNYP